jgi:hypothetical protein
MLKEPDHARWMADNALRRVHELFNWNLIARQTQQTYDRVWSEYCASAW